MDSRYDDRGYWDRIKSQFNTDDDGATFWKSPTAIAMDKSKQNPTVPYYLRPPVKKTTPRENNVESDIARGYAELAEQMKRLQSYTPQQVLPPEFDPLAAREKAQRQAVKAQNPRYKKELNRMLESLNVERKAARQQNRTAKEMLDLRLEEMMGEFGREEERTQEDFDITTEELTEQEEEFQESSGSQFDTTRRALQENLGTAGMQTSGLGRQQVGAAEEQRDISEGITVDQFQDKQTQAELLLNRTFEDISAGRDIAKRRTKGEKEIADIDLETAIARLDSEEAQRRSEIEARRLSAILQDTADRERTLREQFFASITNPAKEEAARRWYAI